MSSPDANQTPPSRRSFRVSLEAALAGVIALALIVVILAGVFSLGQRRLGDVQTATPGGIAPSPALRSSPGLQAPAPLAQAQARPANPIQTTNGADAAAAEPVPPQGEAALAPQVEAPVAPGAPVAVAPSIESVQPPAASAANVRPRTPLGEYLGFTQFTKIRDAFLDRPDPLVNPANVQRPQATSDLAQARSQSRLTPQAVRELVAERQATQSLWGLRWQARIDPNRLAPPATQPSAQ